MDHDRLYATDAEIVGAFFERREDAIEYTRAKYGKLYMRIALSLTNNKEDAEECVSDAYLKLWNAIPPARPADLKAYGSRVTRNICLDRLEKNTAKKRAPDSCLVELSETLPDADGDPAESEELSQAIDAFLRSLDRENRVLFVRRYFYGESYEALSAHTGARIPKIKNALHRIRIRLKKHLEKEGFSI